MTSNFPLDESALQDKGSVLIVDDEAELTSALAEMLTKQGFRARGLTNPTQALDLLREQEFDVLLADLMMPEMDGINLIRSALLVDPNLVCIIMTGQGTVQTAVEAMKTGAFDYILKPFKLNTVLTALTRSLEVRRLLKENGQLREMVNIYELGRTVAFTLDINLIINKTAKAALQQVQADEVSILLPTQDDDSFVIASANGSENRDSLIGKTVSTEGTVTGWVASTLEPLAIQGQVSDPRFSRGHPRSEIQSSISMPMVSGNKLVGVINLNVTSRPGELTPGQIRALSILVSIAASAMENARLYEQTQKRLQRLTALRTIDLAITSSIDLRVTLNILLDQISAQLGADSVVFYLYDPKTQLLDFAAGRGLRTALLERTQMLPGAGYAGAAALERRTLHIADLAASPDPDPLRERLISEEGFHSCFSLPLVALGEVEGVLQIFHRAPFTPDEEWLDYLEALAGQAAIAINTARLFDNLQTSNQSLLLAYNATIEGWSRALDLRDKETEGHTQRVTELTLRLLRAMGGFDDDEMLQIRRGALLHDIGKMGVPDQILLKPGPLTEEEWSVMRKHPEYAYQFLYPIAYLRRALDIPLSHHEHWDGSGYPQGLKGEQIPLPARIFAVADVWDALTSNRPYRPGWPKDRALEYIRSNAGAHFDPQVVEVFLKVIDS